MCSPRLYSWLGSVDNMVSPACECMCVCAPCVRLVSAWNVTDRQRLSRISPGPPNRYRKTESVCSCWEHTQSPRVHREQKENETIFKSVQCDFISVALLQSREFTGDTNVLRIGNRLCLLLNQKLWIAERQAKRGFKLFIYKYQAYPLQLFPLEPKVRFKNKYSLCLQKLHSTLQRLENKTGRQKENKERQTERGKKRFIYPTSEINEPDSVFTVRAKGGRSACVTWARFLTDRTGLCNVSSFSL